MALLAKAQAHTACGCNCDDATQRIQFPVDMQRPDMLTCCECKCCGTPGKGCKVRCSELLRMFVAHERGKNLRMFTESYHPEMKDQHPLFCEDCRDHGLDELKRQAIANRRKRRIAQGSGDAAKRVREASRSRSRALSSRAAEQPSCH